MGKICEAQFWWVQLSAKLGHSTRLVVWLGFDVAHGSLLAVIDNELREKTSTALGPQHLLANNYKGLSGRQQRAFWGRHRKSKLGFELTDSVLSFLRSKKKKKIKK